MSKPLILLLGTCDAKLAELLFVRSCIIHCGAEVKLMDVGRTPISHPEINFSQSELFSKHSTKPDLQAIDRGDVIKMMIAAASYFLLKLYPWEIFDGAICLGGSGGTSLGASVMRAVFPIGFPKIIVSTVAAGNVSNFVGEADITMIPSVVDVAGQNTILNPILENASGMIAGAAKVYRERTTQETRARFFQDKQRKKNIAITMFGVTTPAVDAARTELEKAGYEVFVFHATGAGGRVMERLVVEQRVDGVLDLTTTELADELVGGILSAGPDRLTAASKMGIPQVVSLGGLEMVNFGPRSTVPNEFGNRHLYEHNPDITLMRTTQEESQTLGERLAERLKSYATKPENVRVFIPKAGISMLSTKGGPYHDEVADRALFKAIEQGLEGSSIAVIKDERDINDAGFATNTAKALINMMRDLE